MTLLLASALAWLVSEISARGFRCRLVPLASPLFVFDLRFPLFPGLGSLVVGYNTVGAGFSDWTAVAGSLRDGASGRMTG